MGKPLAQPHGLEVGVEELVLFVVFAVALVLTGVGIGVWLFPRRVVIYVTPDEETEEVGRHDHDYHIAGKRGSQVIYECSVCERQVFR